MVMALLEVSELTKFYDDVRALHNVSFSVATGEFVAVIGPSGSGKTTLIRCINRLIDATQGAIRYDGEDMMKLSGRSLRHARSKLGMIFQHYNLVYRLTVIENVLHGRLGYKSDIAGIIGNYTSEEKEKALEVLTLLGLQEYVYRRCDQLSGGQKQRVGIARALVQNPDLLLADEPVSSLDPKAARDVMSYMKEAANERGLTTLASLHQVNIAREFGERFIGVRDGSVVFDGSREDLTMEVVDEIYYGESMDDAGDEARLGEVVDA
jgi:phosphonate transport system ATP-binding protein